MNQIQRVLIVGGTHGNELTGIYLIRELEQFSSGDAIACGNAWQMSKHHPMSRSSFETVALLANPKAYEIGSRYIDCDLNRCFQPVDLANSNLIGYEAQRAKEIYQAFSSNGSHPADFVIDLHTTTASMGLTVILANKRPFNLQLAAYLTQINPLIKVLHSSNQEQDDCHLRSITGYGCTVEVGPVAQNVLNATLFQATEALVASILDYLEAYNRGKLSQLEEVLTVYQLIERVDYPRNEQGEIQAMIHPQIQGKDYEPIVLDSPLFLTFDSQIIPYKGVSTVYPVFINEAAYYEKGVALCLTEKQQVKLEAA